MKFTVGALERLAYSLDTFDHLKRLNKLLVYF